jgi:hypothetical protein
MTHDQTDTWSGSPPVPPNRGDFYDLLALLPPEQRTLLDDVRSYLESDVRAHHLRPLAAGRVSR